MVTLRRCQPVGLLAAVEAPSAKPAVGLRPSPSACVKVPFAEQGWEDSHVVANPPSPRLGPARPPGAPVQSSAHRGTSYCVGEAGSSPQCITHALTHIHAHTRACAHTHTHHSVQQQSVGGLSLWIGRTGCIPTQSSWKCQTSDRRTPRLPAHQFSKGEEKQKSKFLVCI